MLSLQLTGVRSVVRSAPIPTTSRSAPAACCSRSPAAVPDVRVHYVLLHRQPPTPGRGAGRGRRVPARRRAHVRSARSARRPAARPLERGQGDPPGCRRGRAPDLVLAPSPRRRPPGPPAAGRAGADRLPRPARPALRDPEVGRRPGPAEPLRPADRRAGPRARSSCSTSHFPSQQAHDWWDDEVFLGLMRLRGMECRSATPRPTRCPS